MRLEPVNAAKWFQKMIFSTQKVVKRSSFYKIIMTDLRKK